MLLKKATKTTVSIPDFEQFLRLQRGLNGNTIKLHSFNVKKYLDSKKDIKTFLLDIKINKSISMYRNYLKTFRILYRDFLKEPNEIIDFKFPSRTFKPKILPSREDLRTFYNTLDPREQTIFLLLAESGLRIGELMSCHIDKSQKMLIPNNHTGSTKHSWVSFYSTPIDEIPNISIKRIQFLFEETSKATEIKITPHTLRSIFAREMSKLGVQDRYIDAFCGRTPQSVLARHYSDFSPETLKGIYERANLKIF